MIGKETTPEQLAALISSALEAAGIIAVLSGGAAVQFYSDNAYLTPDLDFVCSARHKELIPVMQSLGFERVTGHSRYYKHPNNDYYVEFPPGPVAVGGRVLGEWGRLYTSLGWINILTPTQCVMDRLASYYAYKDPQSLKLALLVANRHTIDMAGVEAWSREENAMHEFETFRRRLAKME